MPRGHYPRKKGGVEESAPPVIEQVQPDKPMQWHDPLQRGHSIEDMDEQRLRAYAVHIGMRPAEAQSLSVERLRANCKLMLYELIDA
jgi:hypothetical protein